LTLLALPAQAVAPLAFLAKEIVKSIVRSFIEDRLNQMLATAGPCGVSIAGESGLAGLAGMLGGRGSMPGVGSIPGMASMPAIPGIGAAAKGAIPSVPGLSGAGAALRGVAPPEQMAAAMGVAGVSGMSGAALPPGMAEMMKGQMAQLQATAKEQGERGEGRGTQVSQQDMAKAMQAMQDPTPLSAAEADELGTLLERMASAMPSAAQQCAPGEMKALMQTMAGSPMGGGIMRMMLGAMREMQQKLDEARATFASMPEDQRSEYLETMAAEYRGWDKESRQALLGMVETNFLGMPETMKTQLLARLAQEK
jgi:hypothetical protein